MVMGISVYQWYQKQYPTRPETLINTQPIQHPNYHPLAQSALVKFQNLTPEKKSRLIDNLQSNILPLNSWLNTLNQNDNLLLCLGESHREITRQFIAEQIFKQFKFDALYLETNQRRFKEIQRRLKSSTQYFPMLEADILQLLRSAEQNNPLIKTYAIDVDREEGENGKKLGAQQSIKTPREDQIVSNFKRTYTAQGRSAILFGALHCSASPTWFYGKLLNKLQINKPLTQINTRIFSEHEDGPIEAFIYFVDQILPSTEHFVINDTKAFAKSIDEWFPLTQKVTFKPFESIIFYRHKLMQLSQQNRLAKKED